MKALAIPLLRHALAALAGGLVARGYFDATAADLLVGAGLGVANFAWYLVEKRLNRA